MKKEVLLAGILTLTGAASNAVEAQSPSPSPTPIVEPLQGEQEQTLDLAPFLDAVRANVKYDGDPKFFNRMENRARNKPNQFFEITDIPSGKLTLYYPDGVGEGSVPRVGVAKTQDNIMIDDVTLVPNPTGALNAFAMSEAVILDIDQNGSLEYRKRPDLLNWNQIQNGLDRYLVEPIQTRELEWTYAGSSQFGPATLYKTTGDPMNTYTFSGNEFGFLRIYHSFIEIPIVGSDVAAL